MKKMSCFLAAVFPLFLFSFLTIAPRAANATPAELSEPTASFDISSGEAQEQTVILDDGWVATIGIKRVDGLDEKEPAMPCWDSYYPNATGEWLIYFSNPLIYREYYIYIDSSHTITRVWGAYYHSLLCSVTGESLKRSSKSASYRLNWQAMADAASGVALLDATIEGTTLHTYAN